MTITFHLNGEEVVLKDLDPSATLLDFLREDRAMTGTKEGCNEGDCGACTVMVTDKAGSKPLNACILFLPQLNGKSIRTVEGAADSDGTLHPVQESMITHHGSQCGFCTPGFVMSMVTAHKNGATDHDVQLAGNLCRCTGYAPIIRAAEAAADQPVPQWIRQDPLPQASEAEMLPRSGDELATLYAAKPEARLLAGATDLGLWVTKGLRDLGEMIFLDGCEDLKQIEISDREIRFGAMVDMNRIRETLTPLHPSYAEMIRRFASQQVRAAATIGGNIANGSPIGDNPPALIALGARLHLRRGDSRRDIALEDFFIAYGKQDRQPGEFVEAVSIPRQPDRLRVYKLSKRFDQDISAVLGAFNVTLADGNVAKARVAFGGLAGTPKRAAHVEQALLGQPWCKATVTAAAAKMSQDFTPMTDMRASAEYRLETARNMLGRYYSDITGNSQSVLEVQL